MKFGWINLFGAFIVILLLIPNLIAVTKRNQGETKAKVPVFLSVCEQAGRYACIVLMWLPLFVWKFGFESVSELLIYLFANGILLLFYYLIWFLYLKKKTLAKSMTLAILPTAIFLLSGLLLRHWSLVAAAVLFGISHCAITYLTNRK